MNLHTHRNICRQGLLGELSFLWPTVCGDDEEVVPLGGVIGETTGGQQLSILRLEHKRGVGGRGRTGIPQWVRYGCVGTVVTVLGLLEEKFKEIL